jgi:hypothetical protein
LEKKIRQFLLIKSEKEGTNPIHYRSLTKTLIHEPILPPVAREEKREAASPNLSIVGESK